MHVVAMPMHAMSRGRNHVTTSCAAMDAPTTSLNPKAAAAIPMERSSVEETGLPVQDLPMSAMKQALRTERHRSAEMETPQMSSKRALAIATPMVSFVLTMQGAELRDVAAVSAHRSPERVV